MSASRLEVLDLPAPKVAPLEFWGGVECTCNRVGDTYFDQLKLSGHDSRLQDYEQFATLGIRTLRTGLLWERYEQDGQSWKMHDEHLQQIRRLGMRPIAGLLHHGSGPRYTDLLDPAFSQKLAEYAGKVAQRYPWIDAYTPVNEPNTTARFSGLYGFWYPHRTDRESYLRALLNQVRGTVLSMRAIRKVRPDAQLVQTEDAGRITGTTELRSTWEVLNLRQWLTFDLLCGLVDRHHPMFAYMRRERISEWDILWFADNPCPPDVVGLNYYVTSDRYLDHRASRYFLDRGSAEGPFDDTEAVRVPQTGVAGAEELLKEAWRRYRLPVAITEVHLGGPPEEQIRWLAECWNGAIRAQRSGVDCVAMTSWALLGSYYWDELVTRANGHYEPGAFALHNGKPVLTELAKVIAQIAAGKAPRHEALARSGWWRQSGRIFMPTSSGLAA